MDCDYVQTEPGDRAEAGQRLRQDDAAGSTTHDAAEIAAKMPADYNGGDPTLYEQSIKDSSPMFTADGVMPDGGPETVLNVLGTFSDT